MCVLQVFKQHAETAESNAIHLSKEIDLKLRWQGMEDCFQKCKIEWDKEVKQLILKRFEQLKQNEQEHRQAQRHYEMRLQERDRQLDEQESARLGLANQIDELRQEIEQSLFRLAPPSEGPFADKAIELFNIVQCMIKCRKLTPGRTCSHHFHQCPNRLTLPESQMEKMPGFLDVFVAPSPPEGECANYTEVENKLNRLRSDMTDIIVKCTTPPMLAVPFLPAGSGNSNTPEDCLKEDEAAFNDSNLHVGESALRDTEKKLNVSKPKWMGCIERVVCHTSALTETDASILKPQGGACEYFDPVWIENMAFERSNIYTKWIRNVMTPPMLTQLRELHRELTRFEQVKDRTRRLLSQVRVCR